MRFDISEIGAINLTLDFDEDFYQEYLTDFNLQDSEQERIRYIKEQDVEFEVDYLDSEYFKSMGVYGTMTYNDIAENFGEKLANAAIVDCLDGKEHTFEIQEYQEDDIDINNPAELNAIAVKYLKHGEYFKDCRGFILTNGIIVYTDIEHNQSSKIPGIKGTFDFIKLGNIRTSNHGIDIAKMPTSNQFIVIEEILDNYEGEKFYLDLMNDKIGHASVQYDFCEKKKVINDIYNYFNYGIAPKQGVYEKITMKQFEKIICEAIKKLYN